MPDPSRAYPHRVRRPGQREAGSAVIEMTVAVPVLIGLLVFVAVLVHRGVDARLRLADAAHQAARAASLAHEPGAAAAAAELTATQALADAGPTCATVDVDVDTAAFAPGGTVTVTVSCTVDHHDALMLGVPAHTLSATFASPVDTWRSTVATAGAHP